MQFCDRNLFDLWFDSSRDHGESLACVSFPNGIWLRSRWKSQIIVFEGLRVSINLETRKMRIKMKINYTLALFPIKLYVFTLSLPSSIRSHFGQLHCKILKDYDDFWKWKELILYTYIMEFRQIKRDTNNGWWARLCLFHFGKMRQFVCMALLSFSFFRLLRLKVDLSWDLEQFGSRYGRLESSYSMSCWTCSKKSPSIWCLCETAGNQEESYYSATG